MSQIKAGNLQKGLFIGFRGSIHRVSKTEFMSPGKGSAIMRTRLVNIETGNVTDFTFKTNELVEVVDIDKLEMQYLYQDGDDFIFMNPRNYEQLTLTAKLLDGKDRFLVPEQTVHILTHQDTPIGVLFPKNVTLTVTEAEDAVAGNRINAPKKPVTLETGLIVQAPLFIKVGDKLLIDTESGSYLSRAN